MIVDTIRRLAGEEHVPVQGFGPASEMAGERSGHRPEDLFPGAPSLICFRLPAPLGVYRTPTHALEFVWRSQNLGYRHLDTLSVRIAALLDENGARAVPRYGCLPIGVNDSGQAEDTYQAGALAL